MVMMARRRRSYEWRRRGEVTRIAEGQKKTRRR